jgi:hypothetical protein
MTAQQVQERDFPKGHPKAADYVPGSPDALEWTRKNIHPKGERDFPVDSVKAADSKDTDTELIWRPGVDPTQPDLEEFTGATPEVAAARHAAYLAQLPKVAETPMTPEGFVDTGAVAAKTALDFLLAQGHDEQTARVILSREGIDQVLAAKHTLAAKE